MSLKFVLYTLIDITFLKKNTKFDKYNINADGILLYTFLVTDQNV